MLTLQLILMRIRILDPHWKKVDPDPGLFFKIYWIFQQKLIFNFFFIIFFAYFYLKTWWTIHNWAKFYNLFFSKVQTWVLGLKFFLLQFLVDILPLGSLSVDPHIFADPDPGSQNSADPTLIQTNRQTEIAALYI